MSITGLLLMNSGGVRLASRSRSCLAAVATRISGTLYVYLHKVPSSSSSSPSVMVPNGDGAALPSVSALSRLTSFIYNQATAACPALEVKLLHQNNRLNFNSVSKPIEWIFVEPGFPKPDLDQFIAEYFLERSRSGGLRVQYLEKPEEDAESTAEDSLSDSVAEVESGEGKVDVVILGGTFDRIHNGHRILLMEAAIRTSRELIVGITDENMIKRKSLFELIAPVTDRIAQVQEFLSDVAPSIAHRVVPISDPYGPTITEENIDLIVVSQETLPGALKINQIRQEKNYHSLAIHTIQLSSEPQKQSQHEEDKISSSSMRIRTLGLRLRPALKPPSLPYIVGLTGGIASGKSNICKYMAETLGVPTVDCDLLGHETYLAGTACFTQIVNTFGRDVLSVTECGEVINRRCLGSKVFGKPEELKKLTDIVWPEIRRLALERIGILSAQGSRIIVLDAAVLLEGGWEDMCHEVWVTFVPRDEAVQRVVGRDSLSREDAERRIDSQLSNQDRISKATFAFSSLWELDFTRKQVTKAWSDVKSLVDSL